jgi:hypothetical protein
MKSKCEIARITQIDHKTIRALARCFVAEQSKSPGVTTGSDQIPPPRPPGPGRQSISACEPHRAFIQAQLQIRRNFNAILREVNRIWHAPGQLDVGTKNRQTEVVNVHFFRLRAAYLLPDWSST